MSRTFILLVTVAFALGGAGCRRVDIILDVSNQDAGTVDRDVTEADEGQSPDTNVRDVGPEDILSRDTNMPDTVVHDTRTPDTVVNDTNTPDDAVVDEGQAEDTVHEDTVELKCEGPCDTEGSANRCVGTSEICYCGDDGNWTISGCAAYCEAAYGQVGSVCSSNDDVDDCNCADDCSISGLVKKQCDLERWTSCTCSSDDPCDWKGDGYCDSVCSFYFEDDYFDDTDDCTCQSSCEDDSWWQDCEDSRLACVCSYGELGSFQCDLICAQWGGRASDEVCQVDQRGYANCICDWLDCGDGDSVQAQCSASTLTQCTCAADDPCGWLADEYCDTPRCRFLFPDIETFDDTGPGCS